MRFESVSDAEGPDALRHLGDERLVDPLLDQETVRGDADLSTEAELCRHGPIDSAVEVGVVKNLCTQGRARRWVCLYIYRSGRKNRFDCTTVSPIS